MMVAVRVQQNFCWTCDASTWTLKLCVAHLPLTKNGDSRDVPLSRRAVQTLEQLRADGVKHERVFPVTGNSVRLAFEHLRVRAGMLINRDTLADIKPSFENDTNIVPIPPEQSAFSNCEKVVERDVEVYRKKAQSICMHYGVRSANVVSYNAQFPATVKEQQAICGMFDHVALHSVRGRAGFGTSGTALIGAEDIAL
jgi:hypothetical protein